MQVEVFQLDEELEEEEQNPGSRGEDRITHHERGARQVRVDKLKTSS